MWRRLSENERLVLYSVVRYPTLKDKDRAAAAGMKPSTFSAVRQRLRNRDYFRYVRVPMLQRLGCEMLSVIYTHFNPAFPVADRVKKTKETIEISEELFYSVGEAGKGFSLSIARNYTELSRIEVKRISTFAQMDLLEPEHPVQVIFPFDTSRIDRFLDFTPVLQRTFELEEFDDMEGADLFADTTRANLSKREKMVYSALIEHPETRDVDLSEILSVSRHTVAAVRKRMEAERLMATLCVPNLKRLGFDAMVLYHLRHDPGVSNDHDILVREIMNDYTIFLATKRFESFMISVYPTFEQSKEDISAKIQGVKRIGYLAEGGQRIEEYSVRQMMIIKDLVFGPMARKVLCHHL
ncbi:MAG: hypothetical protein AB1665_00780 [Candidatus Thermoplasmatota archaeon]